MEESEEELKSFLMRVNEEGEKSGLKFNIQNSKFMASSPISSWQIQGGKVEAVTNFLSLGSKITADGDCSLEIKKTLAPWKKSYDKPGYYIKKLRHHFADKGPYSQSYSLSIKKDHKEGLVPKN